MNEEWLEGIKANDKVIMSRGHGAGTSSVCKVDRVTKTQIVIGSDRFRRKDGRRVGGDGWFSVRIEECTSEAVEEIKRNALEGAAKRVLFGLCDRRNHLSDEEMDWLIDAMGDFEKKFK